MFLLFYVFASFGVAFVLGYSKITLPIRMFLQQVGEASAPEWHWDGRILAFIARWTLALLECPACLAFWLGTVSIYTPAPDFLPFSAPDYALAPILGFANLGAVLSLGLITNLIRTE